MEKVWRSGQDEEEEEEEILKYIFYSRHILILKIFEKNINTMSLCTYNILQ